MHHQLYRTFLRMPLLIRVLAMALVSVLSFGILIHLIEPQRFPTVFEGIWWAIITTSTVGYGDYVPITAFGRFTAIVLIFIGAGFLSTYFMTLATSAVRRQDHYLEGIVHFRGMEHLIIVGWNERTKEMIEAFCSTKQYSDIILIDESLDTNPVTHRKVHFIKGRASRDEVLLKANVQTAKQVIITADQHKDELEADTGTILALLAIKGLNPEIHAIVEVLTKEQLANAKRAGADDIIESNILSSFMMRHCLSGKGMVPDMKELLHPLHSSHLALKSCEDYSNSTFLDLSTEFLQQGQLLLGIKRREHTTVNPPPHTIIEKEDKLLYIEANSVGSQEH